MKRGVWLLSAGVASGACAGAATPAVPSPGSGAEHARVVEIPDDAEPASLSLPDAGSNGDAGDVGASVAESTDASAAWSPPVGSVDAATLLASDFGLGRLVAARTVLLVDIGRIRAGSHARSAAAAAATIAGVQPLAASELRIEWALVRGPSLSRTERDVAILRCAADDAAIDAALVAMGGDASSTVRVAIASNPGLVAVQTRIDGAQRLLMHVQPHVVAIVPPDLASTAARALSGATIPPGISSGELLLLRENHPASTLNGLVPAGVEEMRIRIAPAADDHADISLEEDTPTPSQAAAVASTVSATLAKQNTMMVSLATRGLLDHPDVASRGRTASAHVHASNEQVEVVLNLIAMAQGAPPLPPTP